MASSPVQLDAVDAVDSRKRRAGRRAQRRAPKGSHPWLRPQGPPAAAARLAREVERIEKQQPLQPLRVTRAAAEAKLKGGAARVMPRSPPRQPRERQRRRKKRAPRALDGSPTKVGATGSGVEAEARQLDAGSAGRPAPTNGSRQESGPEVADVDGKSLQGDRGESRGRSRQKSQSSLESPLPALRLPPRPDSRSPRARSVSEPRTAAVEEPPDAMWRAGVAAALASSPDPATAWFEDFLAGTAADGSGDAKPRRRARSRGGRRGGRRVKGRPSSAAVQRASPYSPQVAPVGLHVRVKPKPRPAPVPTAKPIGVAAVRAAAAAGEAQMLAPVRGSPRAQRRAAQAHASQQDRVLPNQGADAVAVGEQENAKPTLQIPGRRPRSRGKSRSKRAASGGRKGVTRSRPNSPSERRLEQIASAYREGSADDLYPDVVERQIRREVHKLRKTSQRARQSQRCTEEATRRMQVANDMADRDAAACVIQSGARTSLARAELKKRRSAAQMQRDVEDARRHEAAVTVQRLERGRQARAAALRGKSAGAAAAAAAIVADVLERAINSVASVLAQRNQQHGDAHDRAQQRAASTITRMGRGCVTRKRVAAKKKQIRDTEQERAAAARKITKVGRGRTGRRRAAEMNVARQEAQRRERAATKITKVGRGRVARKRVGVAKREFAEAAAGATIRRLGRGHIGRRRAAARRTAREAEAREVAATTITRVARGRLVRQRKAEDDAERAASTITRVGRGRVARKRAAAKRAEWETEEQRRHDAASTIARVERGRVARKRVSELKCPDDAPARAAVTPVATSVTRSMSASPAGPPAAGTGTAVTPAQHVGGHASVIANRYSEELFSRVLEHISSETVAQRLFADTPAHTHSRSTLSALSSSVSLSSTVRSTLSPEGNEYGGVLSPFATRNGASSATRTPSAADSVASPSGPNTVAA